MATDDSAVIMAAAGGQHGPSHVLFIDLGESAYTASVVAFEPGKLTDVSDFILPPCTWSPPIFVVRHSSYFHRFLLTGIHWAFSGSSLKVVTFEMESSQLHIIAAYVSDFILPPCRSLFDRYFSLFLSMKNIYAFISSFFYF